MKFCQRKDFQYTIFNNSGPLTDIKLIPDSFAIAFASKVLPKKIDKKIRNHRKRKIENFKLTTSGWTN